MVFSKCNKTKYKLKIYIFRERERERREKNEFFFHPFGFVLLFCRKDMVKGIVLCCRYDSDEHGFGVTQKRFSITN
jgi:hypothetical protein